MSLALPPSLWTLLDTYFYNLVLAWCAKYNELANAQIVIADQFDPGAVKMPFILIRATERKMAEGEPMFGDGEYHLDGIYYPYEFVVTNSFEEMADAKTFASNASAALTVELALDPYMGGLAAADGEYVKQFEYDDGELYITGLAGQKPEGRYTGAACVRIRVLTER